MRWLLLLSTVIMFALAGYCVSAQAIQTGQTSTKISQACAALAAEGLITNEDEAWKRLTTGWGPIIKPKWGVALAGFLLAGTVLAVAAAKWPPRSSRKPAAV
jgi:hypothetical protein